MADRLPSKLFGDRVRTSTVLLSLLFVAVLVLYLFVRPVPVAERRAEQPTGETSQSTPSTGSSREG